MLVLVPAIHSEAGSDFFERSRSIQLLLGLRHRSINHAPISAGELRHDLISVIFQLNDNVCSDFFVRLHVAARHVALEWIVQFARRSEIESPSGEQTHQLGEVKISPYAHVASFILLHEVNFRFFDSLKRARTKIQASHYTFGDDPPG
jgi:hypothetical protein